MTLSRPPEILAQIRERKKEEAEEKRKLLEERTHQERVKITDKYRQ